MSYNRVVVWPYKLGSHGARELAKALGTICVRANGTFVPRANTLIVNWGNREFPRWWRPASTHLNTLNLPQYVENCSAKDRTFRVLQQAGMAKDIVHWTTDRNVARGWLAKPIYGGKLNAIVCRTLTRSSSGAGIVLAKTPEEVVPAPLYTRYKPKTSEYRIHVFNGQVIDAQEKRKSHEASKTDFNPYIRNHPFGWVFCRENVTPGADVRDASIRAVAAMNLDFGAVDIGYHPKFGVSIYEINSAPGLEGTTIQSYRDAVRSAQS